MWMESGCCRYSHIIECLIVVRLCVTRTVCALMCAGTLRQRTIEQWTTTATYGSMRHSNWLRQFSLISNTHERTPTDLTPDSATHHPFNTECLVGPLVELQLSAGAARSILYEILPAHYSHHWCDVMSLVWRPRESYSWRGPPWH